MSGLISPIRLNKLCEVEDFQNPVMHQTIRELEAELVSVWPDYPFGHEHRKSWEFAQLMAGVRQLGAVTKESLVLAVAAGNERPIFAFTEHVRMMFATDIYGFGEFSGREASASMLTNPDIFWPHPYNRRRLVVQHMNALDLRYEDNTFDLVFSLSSIEHFGGFDGARTGLREMQRVCRPGGIVMLTTECIVNGRPDYQTGNLQLFSPESMSRLVSCAGSLELVEPIQYEVSPLTRQSVRNFEQVVADLFERQHTDFPHIVLETGGCEFTSISIFLRKNVPTA